MHGRGRDAGLRASWLGTERVLTGFGKKYGELSRTVSEMEQERRDGEEEGDPGKACFFSERGC